jgi:ABC-type hemin transport system substrate-binding protein
VVARAPEVIVDAAMGNETGGGAVFAGFPQIPAVRDGRVVAAGGDDLLRTGPRVPAAARRLAAILHPEVGACD